VDLEENFMSNLQIVQRLLACAGAGLALCAVALPAAAQSAPDASSAPSAPTADAQTISRDPDTGQLRAPTAEEQAKLHALKNAKNLRVSPKPMLQKYHSSGARGLRLNDEFLSSSVAVRTPDGRIETICNEAHGAEAPATPHVHAAPALAPVTE
jgi:hypothetical protein